MILSFRRKLIKLLFYGVNQSHIKSMRFSTVSHTRDGPLKGHYLKQIVFFVVGNPVFKLKERTVLKI